MALELIETDQMSFIVDTVSDELRESMGMVFGRSIWLRAQKVVTPANENGTMVYSDYFNNQPVQVCKAADVVNRRELNDDEFDIYQRLSTGRKLVKANREYLINNFPYPKQSEQQELF